MSKFTQLVPFLTHQDRAKEHCDLKMWIWFQAAPLLFQIVVLHPEESFLLPGLMFSFEKAKIVTVMTAQECCETLATGDYYKKNCDGDT